MSSVSTTPDRSDSGVTLVELMITLAVMSLAMGIVASTLILVQRATNRIENSSVAIDDARLVSATLDRELRSAVCISSPAENESGNTLTFQTLQSSGPVTVTYVVANGTSTINGTVTRSENLGQPRMVISTVGPPPTDPTTPMAFEQVMTPLRTVVVDIPIRSDNGGQFSLQTTVAGRNAWRPC